MKLTRTNSSDSDFKNLAYELELYLGGIDGDAGTVNSELNKIDTLNYVIIAYENGNAVGCGGLREYSEKTAELKRMYVKLSWRNKGIATKILNALELWCLELGFECCVLETGKNQPGAIAFYRSRGYRQVDNFGKYINSVNSICFEKQFLQNGLLT